LVTGAPTRGRKEEKKGHRTSGLGAEEEPQRCHQSEPGDHSDLSQNSDDGTRHSRLVRASDEGSDEPETACRKPVPAAGQHRTEELVPHTARGR